MEYQNSNVHHVRIQYEKKKLNEKTKPNQKNKKIEFFRRNGAVTVSVIFDGNLCVKNVLYYAVSATFFGVYFIFMLHAHV